MGVNLVSTEDQLNLDLTAVDVQTMVKAVLDQGLPLTNPPAGYGRRASHSEILEAGSKAERQSEGTTRVSQGKVPTTMRLSAGRLPVFLSHPHRPRGALSLLAGKPATQGLSPAGGPQTAVDKRLPQASSELGPEPPRSPRLQVGALGRRTRPGGRPGCPLTDLPDELDLDALVLQPLVGVLESEAHLPGDRLSVVEEEIFLLLPILRLVLGPLPTLRIIQQDFHLHALPEAEEAHLTAGLGRAGLGKTAPLCGSGALSKGRSAGRRTQLRCQTAGYCTTPDSTGRGEGRLQRPGYQCTAARQCPVSPSRRRQ